ncbi:hypothetical protein [Deminuibacter soli]|nr:hypothetical protein [Deminuibacter soli]
MRTVKAPYTILLLAAAATAAMSCGSPKATQQTTAEVTTGSWQQQPILIDGDDGDWHKPLTYFARKEKFAYSITNDSTSLYILLSTKEQLTQQKILQGGMTVVINTNAEMTDLNAASIGFPTGMSSHRGKGILNRPAITNQTTQLDDLKDYSLSGFNKNDEINYYDYGKSNDAGVEVNLNFNAAGELVYEAKVPLNAIYGDKHALGKNIAVGFLIDGLPPEAGGRSGGGGGGVSIGGGLGMGSFGSGGGVGISIGSGLGTIGGGGKKKKYDLSKTWQVTSLSKRPAQIQIKD